MTGSIMGALKVRHWSDIFVPECKLGPSWGSTHRRMDAWAMRCSWTNWGTVGYEVKHSRADFRQDKKWRDYLPVCSQFYFVTPSDLIQPEEVEDPAGLIWLSRTGNVLRTKKAAKLLALDDKALVLLMSYLLMNRSEITDRPRAGRHKRESVAEQHEQELWRMQRRRRERRVGHALAIEKGILRRERALGLVEA